MPNAATRKYNNLRRMRESYERENRLHEVYDYMSDIFADPNERLGEWRLRPLFEALVDDGYELVQNHFRPDGGGYRLREAVGQVDTTLFANIQGQYLYNAVLREYMMPELIGESLVRVMDSIEVSERIPGVTAIGDQIEIVNEGDPYSRAVTSERWIDTPDTIKRGLMVEVTKEAIFFDKTNLILQQAANIGRYIGINRERRILDVVLGIATVYRRNGQAAQATYASDNTSTSNPLVDWQSLDTADTKFSGLTDPDTGEPIVTTPDTLIVPPALRNTANRIANATMTNANTNNSAGTADRETRVGGNSLNQTFRIASNQYVKERTSSDTSWFYGNPTEAFVYMQNWPLTVEQEGANGPEAFERDVVARYKASERGAAGVMERLYALKATA